MATKTLSQTIKDLNKIVANMTNRKQMRKLGNLSVEIIRERTRGNYQGVDKPRGRKRPLKKVTPQYALARSKKRGLHSEAPKGKGNIRSNLTLTGALLSNLKVLKATKKELKIGHIARKNKNKVIWQAAQGRTFMFLSKTEMVELVKVWNKHLRRLIKRI